MPTSQQPFYTPYCQSLFTEPNPITQSPSSSNAASRTEDGANGPKLVSAVCADNVYSPAIQIYDDGLASQASVTMSPTQAIVPAITQTSPGTNCQTAVVLFEDRAIQKRPSSSFNPANIKKKHTNLGRVPTTQKLQ